MKVFISWSGNDSKQVAELLAVWIKDVLQGVDTWISSEDIEKGSLWINDIGDQLKETTVGVLCLTRENCIAPWILFEAGALSKGLSKSRVVPLLINIAHEELKAPLSLMNATMPNRDDMLKLIKTINGQKDGPNLEDGMVVRAFNRCWIEFDSRFQYIVKTFGQTEPAPQRPVPDMVVEILELARSIQSNIQQERSDRTFREMSRPMDFTTMPGLSELPGSGLGQRIAKTLAEYGIKPYSTASLFSTWPPTASPPPAPGDSGPPAPK
jgi:hypothetical protein